MTHSEHSPTGRMLVRHSSRNSSIAEGKHASSRQKERNTPQNSNREHVRIFEIRESQFTRSAINVEAHHPLEDDERGMYCVTNNKTQINIKVLKI